MIVNTEEGVVAAVFRAVVKGEPGVREPGKLKSVGLVDKGASLNAPNKGAKTSLQPIVSLEYFRERNSPSLRVSLGAMGLTTGENCA